MTSAPLDPKGEVSRALATAIEDFGPRALSNPVVLANLFKDLLPDSPRETTVLVAVAEAGLAKAITDRIEQGLPADSATYQAATVVADARAMDPAAVQWAARQFAQALGYQVAAGPLERGVDPPVPAPEPSAWGAALPAAGWPPAGTVPGGQPGTLPVGPASAAGTAPSGAPAGAAPTVPGSFAGWGAPPEVSPPTPSTSPPSFPSLPPSGAGGFGGPATPNPLTPNPWAPAPTGPVPNAGSGGGWGTQQPTRQGRSKGPIYLAVAAVVAVIAAVIVVVAVTGGGGGGSHSSSTTSTTAGTTTTAGGLGTSTTGTVPSVTSATTTPPTTAGPASSLSSVLPTDLDTTTCQTESSPPTGLTGLSEDVGCGAPTGLPGGTIFAYQFTNPTTFRTGLVQYNKDKAFDPTTADTSCPPSAGNDGLETWENASKTLSGSVECLTLEDSNSSTVTMPAYIWTITQDNAIVEAIGSTKETFAQLNSWFLTKNVPQ